MSKRIRSIPTLAKSWAIAVLLGSQLTLSAAGPAETLQVTDARVQTVMAVQEEVTATLMRQPEVIGTAVGLGEDGSPALLVYVDRDAPKAGQVVRDTPSTIQGTSVEIRLTDKFRAHGGPHPIGQVISQSAPIELGTSGGSRKDFVSGYCCGGTLGALVSINGNQYILSNYHVFEQDISPGGNGTIAQSGDPIVYPGLPDANCQVNAVQTVATLLKKSSLPGGNVDCSIAQVVPGMVRTDGSILEIGTISSSTVAAALNQAVKKSGRTTGLTHSYVEGLNATLTVTYDSECHGPVAFNKTFTGQVIFANVSQTFEDSGDSGSLVVEDVATNPRAIGLLFAGSSTSAAANPIDEVLGFLGATMVGAPDSGTRIINLSGDLAFGDVLLGPTPTRNLTITNTGTSTLTVTSINYPAGFSGNWSSGAIPAGGSRNVVVTFSPTTAASYGGPVTVNSNATSGTNTIMASGVGISGTRIIGVSGNLAFSDVLTEAPLPPQRLLTITNSGNSPLTVIGISYPVGGFSGSWNGTIPAGGSQDILVTFGPRYVGSYNGTVQVDSNKTSGVSTIAASGTGITNNPTREIHFDADNLNFGTVSVGSSAQQFLNFSNRGNSPLTVSSISYPNGFSGDWPGGILAGGEQRSVIVKFSPLSGESYGGLITLNADETSGPNSIPVSATGSVARFANISTRLKVRAGDNALIGGFIIAGREPSRVIIRAIGPSLPMPDTLANPTLELRDESGLLIASNDDWRSTQEAEIIAAIPPVNDRESAIVKTLNPGAYTAIVRDVNNAAGVGLVEVYDLSQPANSRLANISTRGFVGTGDNVMIGGTIVVGASTKVLFRAIGPSLANAGVINSLPDPTLQLYTGNGTLMIENDNWRLPQGALINATGLAPTDDRESALSLILGPGAYTAIVRGVGDSTGVALVEAYQLQ
jgi:hypothetical protein